jgi:hypothetical protein
MSVIINGTSGISTDGGSELFGSGSIGGSLTLTSGTANGVTYLNGSKVLTSGSALTFDGTNFSATGTTTVNSANSTQVSLVVKGETGNGIRQNFIGQTSSGQYNWQIGASITAAGDFTIIPSTAVDGTTFSTAAYAITGTGTSIWSVAASEQMRLTSTGLGIGTSSPVMRIQLVLQLVICRLDIWFLAKQQALLAPSLQNSYASTAQATSAWELLRVFGTQTTKLNRLA